MKLVIFRWATSIVKERKMDRHFVECTFDARPVAGRCDPVGTTEADRKRARSVLPRILREDGILRGARSVLLVAWATASLIVSVKSTAGAAATSQVFSFTGAPQTWQVPAAVTAVEVELLGAQGTGMFGGLGARVRATLLVTPGETLQINVGGAGNGPAGGFNGGGNGGSTGSGGGGATDIRRGAATLGDRVAVAGGGGGSKGADPANAMYGGSGGVTVGQQGGGNSCAPGGEGGAQGSGGAAAGDYAGAGEFGIGGWVLGWAGGGGGGWYGGGGGSPGCTTGGGGGSSYADVTATNVQTWQGWNFGDGRVRLAWPAGSWADVPPQQPHEFSLTGEPQVYFAVGTAVDVELYGAEGAGPYGGLGARVRATLPAVVGQPLLVLVGGAGRGTIPGYNGGGSGGYNGAAGGGGTDIRVGGWSLNDRVLVAGGGGGARGDRAGGSGGESGEAGDGSDCSGGGGGGTDSAGGASAGGSYAGDGAFGIGGWVTGWAGAGGGGWYGGGGGSPGCETAGGGGSSHASTSASNVQMYTGVQLGDGYASMTAASAPFCGNHHIDTGEQCDDGQNSPQDGDGCSHTCQIEPGWTCSGEPSTCVGVAKAACGPLYLSHTGVAAAGRLYGGVAELHWSLRDGSVQIDNLKYAVLDFNWKANIRGILANHFLQCVGPGKPICVPGGPDFFNKISISSEDKKSGLMLDFDSTCDPIESCSTQSFNVKRVRGNNDILRRLPGKDWKHTCAFDLQTFDFYPQVGTPLRPLQWPADEPHFLRAYFIADTRLNGTDHRDQAYCWVSFGWEPGQGFTAGGENTWLDFNNRIPNCNPGDA